MQRGKDAKQEEFVLGRWRRGQCGGAVAAGEQWREADAERVFQRCEMNQMISKEQAIEIAVGYGKQRQFAEFVVDGARLYEEEGRPPFWRVFVAFVDHSEDDAAFPRSKIIRVDAKSGEPTSIQSL
jgi:hypothetical protein